MTKKRQPHRSPDVMAPLTRRIALLLRLEWSANKSAMARDLGISHPVISRVVAGKQEPPGKLLLALAKRPKVNLRWLFLGEGEPLAQHDLGAGGGRYCPVTSCLLPGPPDDFPHLLAGTSLPVAEAYFSQTAYWFGVPHDCPIVEAEEEKVKRGDYLLMETAPPWTRRIERMAGRLIALKHTTEGKPTVVLGRLAWCDDPIEAPDQYPLRLFGRSEQAELAAWKEEPTEKEGRLDRRSKVGAGGKASLLRYRLEDVVGVWVVTQRVK